MNTITLGNSNTIYNISVLTALCYNARIDRFVQL